jgi:co-chaperonin GroES (HSP10)
MGARALVKRLDRPKPESSLIVVPDTVQDKPSQFAVVLAVGTLKQGGFAAGDTVILSDYAGAPALVEFDGAMIDAAIVPEEHVLAVVED